MAPGAALVRVSPAATALNLSPEPTAEFGPRGVTHVGTDDAGKVVLGAGNRETGRGEGATQSNKEERWDRMRDTNTEDAAA